MFCCKLDVCHFLKWSYMKLETHFPPMRIQDSIVDHFSLQLFLHAAFTRHVHLVLLQTRLVSCSAGFCCIKFNLWLKNQPHIRSDHNFVSFQAGCSFAVVVSVVLYKCRLIHLDSRAGSFEVQVSCRIPWFIYFSLLVRTFTQQISGFDHHWSSSFKLLHFPFSPHFLLTLKLIPWNSPSSRLCPPSNW